jgi:hypothetical protein
MIPRDLEELVLADSVGALDAHERAELEARLGALPLEESMQLAQLYETAAALAMAVNMLEPPAYLRHRVLDAARRWSRSGAPGGRDNH